MKATQDHQTRGEQQGAALLVVGIHPRKLELNLRTRSTVQ